MEGKRERKRKIVYWLTALLLFCAFLFCGLRQADRSADRHTAQLVTFGDSVFGLVRDETAIPQQVADKLGMTVYNAAFGGTRAARGDVERRLSYTKDSLSLVGLMRAVGADDFGVQQAVHIRESSTEYFDEVVDGLETLELSAADIILIQHGLNDYYSGIPIYNEEDPYDEYTYAGALRTSLEILRGKCPDARIVLVTPTYSWYLFTEQTCEEFDAGGGLLEDYVAAQKEVAAQLGIEVIDLYHDLFPHESWEDWERYTFDGLHPNDEGRAMIAGKIAAYLDGTGEL